MKKKLQEDKTYNLPVIVQQMFEGNGIPTQQSGGMFAATIQGTHANFQVGLDCGEDKSLLIYVPFPIPVPKHVACLLAHELNRLNDGSHKAEIILQEKEETCKVFAIAECEFNKAPTTDELMGVVLQSIDLLDNKNFHSLACAILGFATYDELQQLMMKCVKQDSEEIAFEMSDGYLPLLNKSGNITSSRYVGRLLAFSIHIIQYKRSPELAKKILVDQASILSIIQRAYDVGDDEERDVIRKLRFLIQAKSTGKDDDNENLLGRLEAYILIAKGKYSLLTEICIF